MKLKISLFLLAGLLSVGATAQSKAPEKGQQSTGQTQKSNAPTLQRKGLFNVSKTGDDWYFEIPDALLGKLLLAVTRYTSTPAMSEIYGGEMTNQQTVFWEKVNGKTLVLRSYLLANHADSLDEVNRAILTSNEHPIIGSFQIESSKGGLNKIKVTNFFNADNPALSVADYVKSELQLTAPVPDASYIQDIKTFPINTEVRTIKTWNSRNPKLPASARTGKVTFGLNVSFIRLPEKPMQQRLFDPRVGYFSNRYNEFSDDQQRVRENRFIVRWRLEPKDEDREKMQRGELVEPKKPIVFYIDPATPKQWRKYLIQGVNDWQKAFEQAGFKNAIIGKEWPENDTTMHIEDARYSVIRYLASPIENAYGPQVHDPRSGEIMQSHICWYHNITSLLHDWYFIQASPSDTAARGMRFDEELMGELVRFVSSHEVGHTLGLRHNFGASHTVPVEKLRDRAWTDAHGHTPSIMDYARFNYVAQPEDSISRAGLFPRIGDYDRWAIEWGYKPTFKSYDGISDRWEREQMVEDSLRNNPRLWWGDGETSPVRDPRNQTEDLGDNAMKASYYGVKNLKRIIKQIPTWTYEYNDIYNTNAQRMHTQVMGQFFRYLRHVANNIGGTYSNFQLAGSTAPRYSSTPMNIQKEALAFLNENILQEPTWLRAESYVSQFTSRPQDLTLRLGQSMVTYMTNAAYLEALNENYPTQAYLTDFLGMLFSELDSKQAVSEYRRALQKNAVYGLTEYYKTSRTTKDTRAYVLEALQKMQKRLKTAAANFGDAPSRLHFAELEDNIAKAFEAK